MDSKIAQKNYIKARTSAGLRGKATQPGDLIMASTGSRIERPKAIKPELEAQLNAELFKKKMPRHLVAI